MIAAGLETEFDIGVQVQWAARISSIYDHDLMLLCPVQKLGGGQKIHEIDLTEEAQGDHKAIIVAIQEAIAAIPGLRIASVDEPAEGEEADAPVPEEIRVRLKLLDLAGDPISAVFTEIRASKIEMLVAARDELDPESRDAEARRAMFRRAPCKLAFVRVGAKAGTSCSSLLVPSAHGPHTQMALQLSHGLAHETSAGLSAMRVTQEVGDDSRTIGSDQLEALLKGAFDEEDERAAFARKVVVGENLQQAILQVREELDSDVVIVGASKQLALGQRLLGTIGGKLIRALPDTTVIITRAANPLTSRFGRWMESVLQQSVPQMGRESRISLVKRVQPTSQIDFDYLALMTLAAVIASIGLVQSSAAVVIGAMLVAPLMTPILGLGIALVQGNPVFARMTIKSIVSGFTVALVASALVGFSSQVGEFDEPTLEMLARGGPGLLDLFVAFASGVAAAYASSRPNLLAAIPGVAIAAALVPPIATAGLALSIDEYKLAFGATLLFVINTFAIVLAAQVSLWAVGLRNVKQQSRSTARIGAGVIGGVLALAIYLSIFSRGQDVQQLLPEPSTLVAAIEAELKDAWQEAGSKRDQRFRLRRIDVSHDAGGYEVIVRVTGPGFVPKRLSDEVRRIARDQLDEPVEVRVVTQYPLDTDPGS